MRLRPTAAPTLATHLRDTFTKQLQRFVCIIDHANNHTSHRGLGLQGYFSDSPTAATNDSPRWRLMRVRPTAAPTLATHLRDTFPEQLQRFVCIVDLANNHTSHRGLVLQGYF